jgi:hypothetical protein
MIGKFRGLLIPSGKFTNSKWIKPILFEHGSRYCITGAALTCPGTPFSPSHSYMETEWEGVVRDNWENIWRVA